MGPSVKTGKDENKVDFCLLMRFLRVPQRGTCFHRSCRESRTPVTDEIAYCCKTECTDQSLLLVLPLSDSP